MDTKKIIMWAIIAIVAGTIIYFVFIKSKDTATTTNTQKCESNVQLSSNTALNMSKRAGDLKEGDSFQQKEADKIINKLICGGWNYGGYGQVTKV